MSGMRPFWYIAVLFALFSLGAACRSPEPVAQHPQGDGCTRLGGGLIHCPNPPITSR